MNKDLVIKKTAAYARKAMPQEAAHDWWHVYRVWKTSVKIARAEGADLFVVQLAALLHDIADWKFNDDESAGPKLARQWLEKLNVNDSVITHVCSIIQNISFKGGTNKALMRTIEGKVVQDADRLDAIGAVGIARTFAYGGFKGRPIHDPRITPARFATFEEYKKAKGTTVNHFYEKLLLLKDLMNTAAAKRIAGQRHKFMEKYLKRFFEEWEGYE